ncbi:hypothetical protein HYW46_03605 [Candidatus Daviesbacteria bacterium]|nr:hypothetical protein [Candidatus Daviesbacteria bacterium]
MEIPNQEKQLYIKNLQLISPKRAVKLGIKAISPQFMSHVVNIFFRQDVFSRIDDAPYRFRLNQPMPAREWILGKEVLDSRQVSHDLPSHSGGDYGKWLAILEDQGDKEWQKDRVIKAKELRAYCWNDRWNESQHVERIYRGYLLYDPRPGKLL